MRILDGQSIADFIKERQAHQVRGLRQAHQVFPRLAIVRTSEDPRIAAYVSLKKKYGADILVDVDEHFVAQADALELVKKLNQDPQITGIIIQLPLADKSQTDELLNAVAPEKDVDGLGEHAQHDPATATAIIWLMAAYNVEPRGKKVAIIGQGRLVGAPLAKLLGVSGSDVIPITKDTDNIATAVREADIIVCAAGSPGVLKSDMVRPGAVVVDAGVATDKGRLVGDIDPELRNRHDLTITPEKGGVGPLTVCALFDNVIRAGYKLAEQ